MGFIYKPFGIILGIIGGLVGKRVFDAIWAKIDDEEPPKATIRRTTWPKLIAAAALQGVIFKVVRVVIDREGARGWHYLTGNWPGKERPEPKDDAVK